MKPDPLKEIEDLTKAVHELTEKYAERASKRYPLTLSLLATFGLAAVIGGFTGIVGQVPLLREHPVALFLVGVVLLVITGSLYKRLS